MKQTAVEFLVEKLSNYDSKMIELFNNEINQAKEMEKQQIIDAYEDGYSDSDNTFKLNEQYYNETFNK
jgi:hypothetical protein